MRSVSNPPAKAVARLRLSVTAGTSAVAVYASSGRRHTRHDVRLARRVALRGHRLVVAVPRSLPAGAWFVVVCPASGRGRCAASRKAMVKLPAKLAAPVQAHPAPEADRAATATIGSGGGTLTATAADGTGFRLDIAAKSVPDGTQITMTPLSSLSGAKGVGSLVGAVQLAPEGLLLLHGGTLTITPARPVPVRNQLALGYTGDGGDLHPVPLAPTRNHIQIPLAHFSGAGVDNASGGSSGLGVASNSAFYEQMIAAIIGESRDGDIGPDDWVAPVQELLDDWLKDIMSNEVPPGLNDDTAARQAIQDLLAYVRIYAMVTGRDGLERVLPTVLKLLDGMYDRAQQRCAQNHDLSQIQQIVAIDRNEQLLGQPERSLDEDVKCARFRVDFDSTIDLQAGSGGSGSWHLEYVAHPTVTLGAQGFAAGYASGSTTGAYAAASGTVTGSDGTTTTVSATHPDTFDVVKFAFSVDPSSTAAPQLVLNLHAPYETYHGCDPSSGMCTDFTSNNWLTAFDADHQGQNGQVTLTLERGSGELFARGTFTPPPVSGDGGWSEATTIDVFHTPPGS